MKRVSYDGVEVGDIVGISYASNEHLYGTDVFEQTLGRYEVVEDRRCLLLKELKGNWFHKIWSDKPLCNFGPDMFFILNKQGEKSE
jgi:hypothetical protein